MSKPKTYSAQADPEYKGNYVDSKGVKSKGWKGLIYVDENGQPILAKNLHLYDTSNVTPYIFKQSQDNLEKADQIEMDKRNADELVPNTSGVSLLTAPVDAAMTFLTPTAQLGALKQTFSSDSNYTDKGGYWANLFNNNGIAPNWFAEKHPISTMLLNTVLDDGKLGLSAVKAGQAAKNFTKLGLKINRNYRLSRALDSSVKTFDGTVGESYFKDPYSFYRITETPEVNGIREIGFNVTTRDAEDLFSVPSNNYRLSVLDMRHKQRMLDTGKRKFDLIKRGSAHGNKTQAAKGGLWGGTTSGSGLFDKVVLEGGLGPEVSAGVGGNRSLFRLQNTGLLKDGHRLGFSSGEMPMDNLTWFRRLPNGRYQFEGRVLPYPTEYRSSYENPITFNKMVK